MNCRTILIIGLILFYTQLFSQNNEKFNAITTEMGLSNLRVRCVYEDSNGFIWLGTMNGLNRYDGYSITTFLNDPNDSTSLSDNYVFNILEDYRGVIWIATNNGLNSYDYNTEIFTRYYHSPKDKQSLISNKITYLFEDRKKNLWIGTLLGLNKYDRENDNFIRFTDNFKNRNPIVNENEINQIIEDKKGNLWLATWYGGLKSFNPETSAVNNYYYDASKKAGYVNNTVMTVCEVKDGKFWLGSWDEGIRHFDPASGNYLPVPDSLQKFDKSLVIRIVSDKADNLYFGIKHFVVRYNRNDQQISYFNPVPSIPVAKYGPMVFSILLDKSGILWISSDAGIYYYNRDNERFTPYYRDFPYRVSSWFYEDKNNLWIGTSEGLFKTDSTFSIKKRWIKSDNGQSLSGNQIEALIPMPNHELWLMFSNGTDVLDRSTGKILRNEKSIQGNQKGNEFSNFSYLFWSSIPTGSSNPTALLVSDQLKSKEFVAKNENHQGILTPGKGLLRSGILTAIIDRQGNYWFGCANEVTKYDIQNRQYVHFTHDPNDPSSLSNNNCVEIYEDKRGTIWIATQSGLNKLNKDGKSFTRFTLKDGLLSDYIYNILEDKHGNLWLLTDKGITKFDPQTQKQSDYSKSDGIDFNIWNKYSDPKGKFYIVSLRKRAINYRSTI